MITIHQSQLRGLNRYRNQVVTRQEQDFTAWLEQNVGEFGQDWGRSYDMDLKSPAYGTTWWFQDPEAAILTLLRWAV